MKQLKHVVGYLPYNLLIYDKVVKNEFVALEFITSHNQVDEFGFGNNLHQLLKDDELLLVLRPMCDLFNNEFLYIWNKELDTESLEILIEKPYDREFIQFYKFSSSFMDEIYKNHFDFYGLIEKGQAININTLEL